MSALPYPATAIAALLSAPRGYDALWYHLPAAVGFARNQHLEPPGRDLVFYFPANGELLMRAALDVFGPRALPLVQWPFAIASALSARALANAIGFRRGAHLAVALILGAPIVLFQSQLGYVDVIGLFALSVSALLLVRGVRSVEVKIAVGRMVAAGFCFGLALGAKYSALPLLGALAPVLFVYGLAPGGRIDPSAWRRALILCVVFLAGALLPSAFWFARNIRLTGNPIFPIAVPLLHFRGVLQAAEFNRFKELEFVSTPWHWLGYLWTEKISHESGFGAGFTTIAPAACAVLAFSLLARLRRGCLPLYGLPLIWGVVYVLFWWYLTPHEVRHLLPLLVLFGVPSLGLLDSRASSRSIAWALTCGILFSTLMSMRLLLFSPTPELSIRRRNYEDLYGLPKSLTSLIPVGARVANFGERPLNYACLGPHLDWRLWDYSSKTLSQTDLVFHDIDFLIYRGPIAAAPRSMGLIELARTDGFSPSWWESRRDDVIILYSTVRSPTQGS